ncbi:MAG: Phospho-2-dehydro-3-deoxyheptonate aldolase, Phe-sensitive [Elusimicrobia bacterium ADurb.Bin231]|nr:MAG: Phospho-2-dehydro-3-deoxyheptonate aldolase, Phe-sensitive [Elusimicrobia bacterium ADurb.Bin231]
MFRTLREGIIMGFKYLRKIPTVKEILTSLPVTPDLTKIKQARDKEIKDVFLGSSDRFIVIVGPCSAHDENAIYDYVARLAELQEDVKEKLILVPRIYTNKPRTTGEGYKGMVHQPNYTEAPNISEGIKAIRRMHIKSLRESHLPAADEMLYPTNYPYLEDILSYVAIGARSVENQQHRLTVSGLDIPAGMKNPTSGDLEVMLNSIQAAQLPHSFIYNDWEVNTSGNPFAHAILRGAVNHYGKNLPNYHYEDMMRLAEIYDKRKLQNPGVIVDTNHANSNKLFYEQPRIAREIMYSRKNSDVLKKLVKGLMIESFIVQGAQKTSDREYGKSITDACLGWGDTQKLIRKVAELC